MYEEHQLPSGETLSITDDEGLHPTKPWRVCRWDINGEWIWSKYFDSEEQAKKEYLRFQI